MRAGVDKSCLCFAGSHANSTSHGVSYGEFWGLHFRWTIGFLIVWLNWYRTCMIGYLAQGTGGNELFDGWYYSYYVMPDKNVYHLVAVCIFDEKQFIGPQYSWTSDWHIMWFAVIKGQVASSSGMALSVSDDDVIKWKHFLCYWPFAWGIHRSSVNSPHKGQWHGALMFSLICAWINGWVNNHEAGDLRHHHAHYDVSVMHSCSFIHVSLLMNNQWLLWYTGITCVCVLIWFSKPSPVCPWGLEFTQNTRYQDKNTVDGISELVFRTSDINSLFCSNALCSTPNMTQSVWVMYGSCVGREPFDIHELLFALRIWNRK